MSGDKFLGNSPRTTQELTSAQLERLMVVKIDPSFLEGTILSFIREGNSCRFIVSGHYDLYLSLDSHQLMFQNQKIGVDRASSLITNGWFSIKKDSKAIKFDYNFLDKEKDENARRAAESKIKGFLKSKGVEFKG